jgi:hypothetical protein
MKYKNYKSAIHNFSHSFQSIDFTNSGRLAINVLIELHNLELETTVIFDFILKKIEPRGVDKEKNRKLLFDYLDWLPEHFQNHKCDIDKLERLEIKLSTDFSKAITPLRMNDTKEIELKSTTKWKVESKEIEEIEITQTELIKSHYLKVGIPEI